MLRFRDAEGEDGDSYTGSHHKRRGGTMRRRPIAVLLAGTVATISIGLALVTPEATASAKTAKSVREVCTSLVGGPTMLTFSGCKGSKVDGNTAVGVATGSNTITVTFNSGLTAFESYSYKTLSNDKCTAPTGFISHAEYTETGTILSGGTATDLVGSKISGKQCVFIAQIGGRIRIDNFPTSPFTSRRPPPGGSELPSTSIPDRLGGHLRNGDPVLADRWR